jgi:hypothetical protein
MTDFIANRFVEKNMWINSGQDLLGNHFVSFFFEFVQFFQIIVKPLIERWIIF